ncbi:MAG: 2OG-Fe(II) oxygenase [Alphaproteobacteria bacterium]|nr:2OG-Fe(II) oxygenase [Alphaproteobacteria bacterium]
MPPNLKPGIGDCMPNFQLMDTGRHLRSLLTLALGRPTVALFYEDNRSSLTRETLQGFIQVNRDLTARADVFAINSEGVDENVRFSAEMNLPFPLLSDPEQVSLKLYDLGRATHQGNGQANGGALACLVADSNRRILRIDPCVTDPGHARNILAFVNGIPEDVAEEAGAHAPVLVVPRVFDPELCRRLIEQYETAGNQPSGLRRGEEKNVIEADKKIRSDHILVDPQLQQEAKVLITKRVIPELSKAFGFQAKRGESLKIACYDAKDGGFFQTHRDNCNPVGGRRFAMTLNLNTGAYEGGYLKFPEYGGRLYRPAIGDAVLFSCLLAHEATPVTAGRRFALLTFFLGD